MNFRLTRLLLAGTMAFVVATPGFAQSERANAPAASDSASTADPANWPAHRSPVAEDAAIEARITDLLARMSLEQKVGQVVQGDIASITPDDVRRYHLGSVFNGGNSDPGGRYNAPAAEWLALADAFWDASTARHGDLPVIPAIWASTRSTAIRTWSAPCSSRTTSGWVRCATPT